MSAERDTAVVILDLVAGMTYYHDGSELGDVYAELYQLLAQQLLSDSQETPDEHQCTSTSYSSTAERSIDFFIAFCRLPKADQQVLRALLATIVSVK